MGGTLKPRKCLEWALNGPSQRFLAARLAPRQGIADMREARQFQCVKYNQCQVFVRRKAHDQSGVKIKRNRDSVNVMAVMRVPQRKTGIKKNNMIDI